MVDKSVITCRDVYESIEIIGPYNRTELFQCILFFFNVPVFFFFNPIQIVFFLDKGDTYYFTRGNNRFVGSTQGSSYNQETVVLNNLTPSGDPRPSYIGCRVFAHDTKTMQTDF